VTRKAEPLLFRPRRSLASRRAGRFVWVGAGGFAVQGLALYALAAAGLPYPAATALAVEAAIVHNFLWHERWTWGDRAGEKEPGSKACSGDRMARFVRFNGSTAVISIAGNVALMGLFVGSLGLPLLPSNLVAVLTLSVLNYVSADRLVFATKLTRRPHDPTPM
jgi:putative flippase GtrA